MGDSVWPLFPGEFSMLGRRGFLAHSATVFAGMMLGDVSAGGGALGRRLIGKIDAHSIFQGREKQGPSWFHPRPTLLSGGDQPRVLMTLQLISGSDVFGPVHWTESGDLGNTWSRPEPIPGLGRTNIEGGWERGVCDVVPEYHAASDTVLAIGHDVFYKDGVLARPQRTRRPVYVVRDSQGEWSSPRHMEWDRPDISGIFSCGCSQRVNLPEGDVLIPLTFGPVEPVHRSVTSVRCRFDGTELTIVESGSVLVNKSGRGLLEPSLVAYDGEFFMTIRAEDECGYVARSSDGLKWETQQPWCWDDGTPLTMSTTQQHWMTHSDGLFLVYTRKSEENSEVIRFRAPLYMAKVDRKSLRLIRESERVVIPIQDDPAQPRRVALLGNFHTLNVTPEESWVTVGENRPYDGYLGDTWLGRVRWSKPNQLVENGQS